MGMQQIRQLLSFCVILLFSAAPSFAAITTYTDRDAFVAVLAQMSGEQSTEDFNAQSVRDFSIDTSVDPDAISDAGFDDFSISGVYGGTDSVSIGIAAGTGTAGTDNTQYLYWSAECSSSDPEGTCPKFSLVFARAVQAFGFDWSNTDSSDIYGLRVTLKNVEYPYFNPPFASDETGFFGVIADEPFEQVEFYSVDSGGTLKEQGMDNLVYLWPNDFSWPIFMPAIQVRK